MSGIKHDSDKPKMHLTPARTEIEEAKVWTFGSRKYDEYNWAKGLKFSRIISAAKRHLNAIQQGEDIDAESGCLHAAHVRCCMAMLIEFTLDSRSELDDRLVTAKKDLTDYKPSTILAVSNNLTKELK